MNRDSDDLLLGVRRTARGVVLRKWGPTAYSFGYAQIPNIIIRMNRFLEPRERATASEFMVLITIISYWYREQTMPFPSIKKLSEDTKISERQIKRIIKSLSQKGLIKLKNNKQGYGRSNKYDLLPLIDKIETHINLFENGYPSKSAIDKFYDCLAEGENE